jgi:hypothetical protein
MTIQFAYVPYARISEFLEGERTDIITPMEWNQKFVDDAPQKLKASWLILYLIPTLCVFFLDVL